MDTIKRLENWKSGHKSRYTHIYIDDGYGATCWNVALYGKERKIVYAAEVNFIESDAPVPENVVFVIDGNSDEEWPGLEAVINAAIDRAEKLGL